MTIYCLPAGTVVFTKFSTTEFDGPNGKVTRLASFGSVAWRASELLWDGLEGMDAPVQNLDEDEEYDPDSQVTLSGEADLWRQWSRKVIERFWYLGQSRRIRLHTGPLKAAKFRGGWLHVSAPGGIDQYGQLREAVRDWLEGRARQRLPDVVAACRDRIKLPVPPVDITDDWKSWARSPDGRLVVGWRLVQAHPTVAEYVITRELIRLHSRQRGFDPSVRLTRALPDHLNRRETLRHFRENLDDWGF
ncbi:MAG: DUF45 domain-containing protein [Vicinamibacterales bacterium]|nr:DUF45 domain-containing protein [Vicinamibacterales bacterium]